MEDDFNKKESRKTPTTELVVQKNYLELVPRPSEEDYQRLKDSIARNGFDDADPIKVNEDMVVLDGHTRLQIAKELGLEWVYTIVKESEDHYSEKLYIINTNLDQRHLTKGQRIELGKKLLEIKQADARERQSRNLKQNQNLNLQADQSANDEQFSEQNNLENCTPFTVPPILAERQETGEALVLTAHDIKIGKETLRKGLKILEAAETDPEIAEAWNQVKAGKSTVNQVYQKVREKAQRKTGGKTRKNNRAGRRSKYIATTSPYAPKLNEKSDFEKMTELVPDPEPYPDDELMDAVYQVADLKGVSREAIDGAMELIKQSRLEWCGKPDNDILGWFRLWSQGLFDAKVAWDFTMDWVHRWQEQQRAKLPQEVPVPANAKKLGPWVLDYVHQVDLDDLVREFPAETVHMVYSDTVLTDLEQIGLLGEFAARALTEGKYLCVYVEKWLLPEAMDRLSGTGLTYLWTCSVFRPEDKRKVTENLLIREKWLMLLVYRKGGAIATPDWFPDGDGEGVHLGQANEVGWDWFDDAVEERRPTNRGMIRQLLKGLTIKGQLVVDPLVGSGVTGQASRSLGRRFLCFGADAEDVRAANQRIAEMRLAEEGAGT